MKKVVILVLVLMMSFGVASVSWASAVSLDVWSNGEGEFQSDLSQVSIGLDIPMNKFKFSGNFASGTIKNDRDFDTSNIILKEGYALLNNEQVRLDLIGGFYARNTDIEVYYVDHHYYNIETLSYYSLIIGIDSTFKLNEDTWFDFGYCLGLDPQALIKSSNTINIMDIVDSISVLNLKLNHLFREAIGASLGYSRETISLDNSAKARFSGITIGAFYKF